MKIAFLMHSYYKFNKGGAEYQAFMIAKKLLKYDFDVHFVFLQAGYAKTGNEKDIKLHPIKKIRFNILSHLKLIYFLKIYSELKEIQPDIIYHRNLSSFLFVANFYAKLNNIRTILHISHDKDVEEFRWNFSVNKILRSVDNYFKCKALRKVNTIICQTFKQKSTLLKNYHRNSVLIRNFYELCHIVKDAEKEDIVVWIANIKKIKNPLAYIKLADILGKYNSYKFLMIGREPSGRSLYKKFHKSLMQSNVEYLGEIDNSTVNKILSKAKILCCTSYTEGFPNTFVQAWVRKVPTVSLYVDPDDIIKKEKIGFHSKGLDQMVMDVEALIKDDKSRKSMGEKARQYALNNHSLSNIQKIVDLFDK